MIASERRRQILGALNSRGVISLKDMAKELGVSEITVRRDFEKLEADGRLKRVQGGATSLENPDGAELTMTQKLPIHMEEKKAVARYAASLVQDGDCVFVDGGTSMLPFVLEILRKQVRIITYNTMFLGRAIRPTAQILLIGGEYRPHYDMNVGPIAQDMLRQFFFDKAFFSCAGLDPEQQIVYTTETESMEMKRIAMENARHCHLLLDASKFTTRGFVRVCYAPRFDSVICDRRPEGMEVTLENLVIASDEKK